MRFQSFATGLILLAVVVMFQPWASATSTASPVVTQQTPVASGWRFARLRVETDGRVTWLVGGEVNPRTESVRELFRRLGGRQNGTFSDLLNQIGAGGWQLAETSGNIWVFTRKASN